MPNFLHVAILAATVTFLGGCCRDTVREMASLKDTSLRPQQQRSAKAAPEQPATKSAKADQDDVDKAPIETGSISASDCQGQHLAYQATKEYLKNFGPRPPDEPGEKGPCRPDAQ